MDFSNIKLTAERIMERPEWEGEAVHWTLDLNGEKVEYSEGLGHFINQRYFSRRTMAEDGIYKSVINPDLIVENQDGVLGFPNKDILKNVASSRVKVCPKKRNRLVLTPPDIKDALHSLTVDASGADESFSDWCDNIGCDDDSIKAKKMYDACQENAKVLRRLGLNLDELQEFFQDY